jgi:hypothetical protein
MVLAVTGLVLFGIGQNIDIGGARLEGSGPATAGNANRTVGQ